MVSISVRKLNRPSCRRMFNNIIGGQQLFDPFYGILNFADRNWSEQHVQYFNRQWSSNKNLILNNWSSKIVELCQTVFFVPFHADHKIPVWRLVSNHTVQESLESSQVPVFIALENIFQDFVWMMGFVLSFIDARWRWNKIVQKLDEILLLEDIFMIE